MLAASQGAGLRKMGPLCFGETSQKFCMSWFFVDMSWFFVDKGLQAAVARHTLNCSITIKITCLHLKKNFPNNINVVFCVFAVICSPAVDRENERVIAVLVVRTIRTFHVS